MVVNIEFQAVFCPKQLDEMTQKTQEFYVKSQKLANELYKIEHGTIHQYANYINNVINFYKNDCNKPLYSYLDRCKAWRDAAITAKQLEKVILVEEIITKIISENNHILNLAYKYKSQINEELNKETLH